MTSIDEIVRELSGLMEKATPGPWRYRPSRHDDWGVVRAPNDYYAIQAHAGRNLTDKEAAAHRAAKTDPFAGNALFIVAARNHLPAILSALARSRRMEEALRSISRYAVRGDDIHFDGIVESARAALEDT